MNIFFGIDDCLELDEDRQVYFTGLYNKYLSTTQKLDTTKSQNQPKPIIVVAAKKNKNPMKRLFNRKARVDEKYVLNFDL